MFCVELVNAEDIVTWLPQEASSYLCQSNQCTMLDDRTDI